MNDALFAWDYATLPACCTSLEYVTNPTELIRGEALYRMLRLCGIECDRGIENLSDWELFRDFCECYPMLRGFPAAESVETLLHSVFSLSMPLSREAASELWRACVADLERNKRTFSSFLPLEIAVLGAISDVDRMKERCFLPIPDGQSLLPKTKETFDAWRASVRSSFERLSRLGVKTVRLRLPKNFLFTEPNPYTVDRALKKEKRQRVETQLLLSQLFRELCVNARAFGMGILLECDCELDALPLLSYTERAVKLPEIALSLKDPILSEEMQEFLEAAAPRLSLALSVSAFPTELELERAICSVAARYPVGRLSFVTGEDLRLIRFAQEKARVRIGRAFEKSFEKK